MGLCVVLTGQSSLLKRGVVEEGLVDCSLREYIRILLCPHPVLGALPQIVEMAGQGVSGPHVLCVSVCFLWSGPTFPLVAFYGLCCSNIVRAEQRHFLWQSQHGASVWSPLS